MSEAPHTSVLLDEVVEAMAPAPGRQLVDATFGAGGYTRALLEAGASVTAFDRDPSAARFAGPLAAEFPGRFTLVQRRFSELEAGLAEAGVERCDGVAFDLGVSSMQLDEAERGFSFMRDGPLDMRMGGDGPSAADLVNTMGETDLAHLIWTLGDERGSRKIAKYICNRRAERRFERTLDFANIVERALGGRKGAPVHPATRTFQALRIAVNEELAELQAGLDAAERVLAPGGRLVVVTFHSLEDRIAKGYFAERAGKLPGGSRHLPPTQSGPPPSFELLFNGARAPREDEVARNPRARSAKIRAGIRTAAPAWRQAA
jgi:16S rRNA (cytosine1402-N4)-methyltransferase